MIIFTKIQKENPNSNLTIEECKKQGKCIECGNKGLWADFGSSGKWRAIRCPTCNKKGVEEYEDI